MNKNQRVKTIISELREDKEIKNLQFKVNKEECFPFSPCRFEINTATGDFLIDVEDSFVSVSFEKDNYRVCYAFYDIEDDYLTVNIPSLKNRELLCDNGVLKTGTGVVFLSKEDNFNWQMTHLVMNKIKRIITLPTSVKFIERL